MTSHSRLHRGAEWALWFVHQPLAFLWIIIASMVMAAAVTLFSSPRHAMELIGLAGSMTGVLKVLAQLKGLPAWPRLREDNRTAHEAPLAAPPKER